jgi:hypothetical protein
MQPQILNLRKGERWVRLAQDCKVQLVSRAARASVPKVKGYAQTGSDSICLMVGYPEAICGASPGYLGVAVDQSVKGTARPPRTTVGMTWSKPLWSFAE